MTSIEWTQKVWNPVVGCSRVSPGCVNCYAEKFVHRGLRPEHRGLTVLREKAGVGWTGEVRFLADRLSVPQEWKRGRKIFVNSLSDVFHEDLPHEKRAAIFGAMLMAPQHTYQILTKRPKVAVEFESWLRSESEAHGRTWWETCLTCASDEGLDVHPIEEYVMRGRAWWIGCTMEDQARVDARMPMLLSMSILPTKKIVSYEPALEAVDFGLQSATCDCHTHMRWKSRWIRLDGRVRADFSNILPEAAGTFAKPGIYRARSNPHGALSVVATNGRLLGVRPDEFVALDPPDWVICGGESGPKARPFNVEWMASAIKQCRTAGVAVFCKQLGAHVLTRNDDNFTVDDDPPDPEFPGWPLRLESEDRIEHSPSNTYQGAPVRVRLSHGKGADMEEWRSDLRVREFPS